MPDIGHMYPDLMCPARFEPQFQQSCRPEALQNLEMCHCMSSVAHIHRHLFSFYRMPADRCIDFTAFLMNDSFCYRCIHPFDVIASRRHGHHRRNPRARPRQARRPPGAFARAAGGVARDRGRCSASAFPRPSGRSRRWRVSSAGAALAAPARQPGAKLAKHAAKPSPLASIESELHEEFADDPEPPPTARSPSSTRRRRRQLSCASKSRWKTWPGSQPTGSRADRRRRASRGRRCGRRSIRACWS